MARGALWAALSVGLLPALPGVASAAVAPYATDSNTIALWHFDETANPPASYADSAGTANRALTQQGTVGSLASVPGLFGAAVTGFYPQGNTDNRYLTPTGGFGVVPNPATQTLEAWVKFDDSAKLPQNQTANTVQMIYRNAGSQVPVEFSFTNSGGNSILKVAVKKSGDVNFTTLSADLGKLNVDTWYHIAYSLEQVSNDLNVKLYFQSQAAGVAAPTPVAAQTFTNFAYNTGTYIVRIGEAGQTGADPFAGVIDEMRLSNVARTNFTTFAVPEVASLGTLSVGAAGTLLIKRRR